MVKELDISVIIPIYNNSQYLVELSVRLMKSLASVEYEIIYVNDNSPDDSLLKIRSLSEQYPMIRYVNLLKNMGQQQATLEGLKVVMGKKIVVLDGDLQDSPELIPKLYGKTLTTGDAAFVKRNGKYQSTGRMLTSVLIKRIIQMLSGLHYKAGSYYIFDKSILPRVVSVASKCQYPYMSIIVAHFSSQIEYLTAGREKRVGLSSYNFGKRIIAATMAIYCSTYCIYTKATSG